jgi:hypothetical protein
LQFFARKTGFPARKNTTRRDFLGNPGLQMNLVVNGGFGVGACGKGGREKREIFRVDNKTKKYRPKTPF